MTIRPGRSDDIPAILLIERASDTAAHWSEEEYAHVWDVSGVSRRVLVAESDGAFEGFLVARGVVGEWELENIAVSPESRGRGIGSALLDELLRQVRDAQGTRLMLEVRASNAPARKLYEKHGLRQVGTRKNYYQHPTEDAVLYDILV